VGCIYSIYFTIEIVCGCERRNLSIQYAILVGSLVSHHLLLRDFGPDVIIFKNVCFVM
jgi:hypothetical protein